MKITWFDSTADGKTGPDGERAMANAWVNDHKEELHEIQHLVNDNEMEAVKIITGNQKIDKEGKMTIRTLELHFMKDLVLVLRTIQIQDPASYTMRRTATQLGYLEMPCCEDDCCDSRPITKKEIK